MLHWMGVGTQGQTVLWQGNLSHPRLTPGTTWSTPVEWPIPTEDYIVTLKIIRLTGLTALGALMILKGTNDRAQQDNLQGKPG
jgi:hypothetical protein